MIEVGLLYWMSLFLRTQNDEMLQEISQKLSTFRAKSFLKSGFCIVSVGKIYGSVCNKRRSCFHRVYFNRLKD